MLWKTPQHQLKELQGAKSKPESHVRTNQWQNENRVKLVWWGSYFFHSEILFLIHTIFDVVEIYLLPIESTTILLNIFISLNFKSVSDIFIDLIWFVVQGVWQSFSSIPMNSGGIEICSFSCLSNELESVSKLIGLTFFQESAAQNGIFSVATEDFNAFYK